MARKRLISWLVQRRSPSGIVARVQLTGTSRHQKYWMVKAEHENLDFGAIESSLEDSGGLWSILEVSPAL